MYIYIRDDQMIRVYGKSNFNQPVSITLVDGTKVFPASYSLVNIQKTMESHHFQWANPLFRLGHVQ